ncbi:hypothetical protein J5J83_17490 [Azoarcus sp. L1K30]|uniref:ABC transporter substrate-binding protein n=1 Tax=Azoarcus sp. L1K30 TaxID=2820277 RepID=UPI001B825103|nr:ABC transporter substrate binding protein [Azoarcus sp. L1K30]MBR0567919.1 hypothetical protein [Azoarcus sp. L1K30]
MIADGHGAGTGPQVAVLMRTDDNAHVQAYAAIRDTLHSVAPEMEINKVDISAVDELRLKDARIVVSLGSLAARTAAERRLSQPVIHSLLPESAWLALPPRARGAAEATAIVLDQPAERQIALIRQALPEWRRIALLAGSEASTRRQQLAGAARSAQLEVREAIVDVEGDLYPAMQRVLSEPAVLIVTPDARIFNSYTVQNVLLTAYRHRSPVLGFSAAYVHAGALLALYSTPAQIGRQTAELVMRLISGRPMPPVQSPQYFQVATNLNVARSLGVTLDSADVLTATLAKDEKGKP